MKKNICFVSLNNEFTKNVARDFAGATDMFFADITELMQFDLIDIMQAQQVCGPDYIKKIERNKIKNVCTYDNTCISIDYEMLNDAANLATIKNDCVVVLIDYSFTTFKSLQNNDSNKLLENKLSNTMFGVRKKLLNPYADVIINWRPNSKFFIAKIANTIMDYYKKTTLK